MAGNSKGFGYKPGVRIPKFREEVYRHIWIIPVWNGTKKYIGWRDHKLEFETGKFTRVQTKWIMDFGFTIMQPRFSMFWKLIDVKGYSHGMVQASTSWTFLKGETRLREMANKQKFIRIGERVEFPKFLDLNNKWTDCINPNGELVLRLKIIIMEPDELPVKSIIEQFHKGYVTQMCNNFAGLVNKKDDADITIITRDGKELFAHKVILKAQCPVFETMFRSDFSESATGIVNLKDISAKTMRILLHLFYSGELLPSWKDSDTVVEFTYAAGKYQLTNVLKLLDEVVGSRDDECATKTDVQLLDLSKKLDLKTAERELEIRIRKRIK